VRVLKYGNRKANDVVYDISTPEKLLAAYLLMFNLLNEEWEVYIDLYEDEFSLCKPCADGHHEYCRGGCNGSEECPCDATPECKNINHRTRAKVAETNAQRTWFKLAEEGDARAARSLIRARRGNEYEEVTECDFYDPIDPLTVKR